MPVPYIDVHNLSKRYADEMLFSDLTFSISEGQRVALVGLNGTGKSTLLSILARHEYADGGTINYRRDLRIAYLEQSPVFPEDSTVLDACCLHADEGLQQRAKKILTRLHLTDMTQRVDTLSGGQQKRLALARVLLQEFDILLLDEPTNHLDLGMIEWMEDYLSRSVKTLLMVTHDRYFLDRVCNVILEIDNGQMYSYRGNYAYFLEKRQQRLDVARAEQQRANNLYRRELEWMRRQPQARGHKARYREEAFYELQQQARRRIEERAVKLQNSSVYIGNKIFEAQYVSKAYGDTCLLKDFYYNFSRFEKMGIVGDNGTGKSTFLKLLMGREQPDGGRFDIGETVRFGYFSQEGLQFDEQDKVIDVVRNIAEYINLGRGRQLSASQLLEHFLFSPAQQHSFVAKLSGGERRKLYLCPVPMQKPNFLVLDEPTNDRGIQTLQVLEEWLYDFPGCVIIVSHDRYFMDKVVDHLLVFRGGGQIDDFPGNYTQYRQWQQGRKSDESTADSHKNKGTNSKNDSRSVGKGAPQKPADGKPRKLTFKAKYELEQIEKELPQFEAQLHELEASLGSPDIDHMERQRMAEQYQLLQQLIDDKTLRWMQLQEE